MSSVRIFNSPPCVERATAATAIATGAKTTVGLTSFTVNSVGSNAEYRWEVVYDRHGTQTTQSSKGSTIASTTVPRTAAMKAGTAPGCRDAKCSVMQWNIPLPGSDATVPNYDEITVAVVGYNKRGAVRPSDGQHGKGGGGGGV